MPVVTKTFHLGTKPYGFKLEEHRGIILVGRSIYDSDKNECTLEFYWSDVPLEGNMNPDSVLVGAKKLGSYNVRSDKFKYGMFENFDAQRYIKSRYRDLIRLAHRQQNKSDVIEIFSKITDELGQMQ